MKWYEVTYTDGDGTDQQTWMCKAFDAEHAHEKFMDSFEEEGGTQGVKVICVIPHRVKDSHLSRLINSANIRASLGRKPKL
tara:strand:- start:466 stop:708 length:243 start_codon:yes stop_codon:yes gene_type:complete